MKILDKPLSSYITQVRVGLITLAVVAVIRFTLLPVFGVPYGRGTHWVSVTLFLIALVLVYSVAAARLGGSFRDVLGISACLVLFSALLIIVAIAIDDLGGIDSYYTDPMHGGELNPWLHMGAHALAGFIFTVILWGIGSVAFLIAGGRKKTA